MRLKTLLSRLKDLPAPLKSEEFHHYLEDLVKRLPAVSTLQEAFGITENELEEIYAEAYFLYEKEEFSTSTECFQWLARFNPFNFNYWMGLGASQQMQKSYGEAQHAYAVAALLNGEDPAPHFHAHECAVQLQQYEDASGALDLASRRARCPYQPFWESKITHAYQSLNQLTA